MPEKLRLRFEKTGRAIYISHLDLMRTMQRVFLRADCPLKYSEGFNPHALISILLPLSVGVGSVCELMDFQLREEVDLAALPERLTAVMPEGIRALEAYPGGRKVRELKWLRVTGRYEYDNAAPADMAEKLRVFRARRHRHHPQDQARGGTDGHRASDLGAVRAAGGAVCDGGGRRLRTGPDAQP